MRAERLGARARKKFIGAVIAITLAFGPTAAEKAYDAFTERAKAGNAEACMTEVMKADRLHDQSPEIADLYAADGEATGLPRLTDEDVERDCGGGAEDVLEGLSP